MGAALGAAVQADSPRHPPTYLHCDPQIVEYVFAMTRRQPYMLDIPAPLMKALAAGMSVMPGPWTTPDEVEANRHDNTLETAMWDDSTLTTADLQMKPVDMERYAFNFLHRYRMFGHFSTKEATDFLDRQNA